MSGLEVVGAVAAVVSAFHGGAELVAHIKKKQRRRSSRGRSQQEFEEKQLQDSLETGETQVGIRYSQDLRELGEIMKVGDAIARDRLLHIAVVMQAEVIKSLQLAVKYENAVLNLQILHESSIVNRKDSISCLDELKQRILITRPLPRILTSGHGGSGDSRTSLESMQSFRTVNIPHVPDNYIPSAVTIPAPGDSKETKSGLAGYFSMKRNSRHSSTSSQHHPVSSAASINFSPALNHLIQGSEKKGSIMKDIDEIISSYQGLYADGDKNHAWARLHGDSANAAKRDTLAILNGGDGSRRDTYALNQDALLMLKNLPPTPEDFPEHPTEYPTFNHNVFNPHQPTFNHYYAAPNSQLQQMPEQQSQTSRWSATSASSSVYSDTVPPSLYSRNSVSSNETPPRHNASDYSPRESPVPPATASFAAHQHPQAPAQSRLSSPFSIPHHIPTSPVASYAPPPPPPAQQQTHNASVPSYSAPRPNQTPPPPLRERSPVAPRNRSPAPPQNRAPSLISFASSERTNTPPNAITPFTAPLKARPPPSSVAPFATPQQPRTPIEQENDGLRAGRTRVHLVPGQLVESSAAYGITTSITSGPPPPTLKDEIYTLARRNKTPSPTRAPVPAVATVFVPISHTNSDPSSASIRSSTIQGPTTKQEKMMDGRPCKENRYWGFCKGAWAIREETKRGLGLQSVPNGMYNTKQIWQCKTCLFQGDVFSAPHPTKRNKKEMIVDPTVHNSAVGIRYKWIFLAKSHVKQKTMSDTARSAAASASVSSYKNDDKEDYNYGCTICSVEGNVTGIYGNVETLMNHIFLEHTRTISDKTCAKTKCIVGREANLDEEWDINIPMTDILLS